MAGAPHVNGSEELLRRFAAAIRSTQLYSGAHPIVARNLQSFTTTVDGHHRDAAKLVIGLVGEKIVVDDVPVATAEILGGMVSRLRQCGIERITIERGATHDELGRFVTAVATMSPDRAATASAMDGLPHVRVGRVQIEDRVEGNLSDVATVQRLYTQAVAAAAQVWDSAQVEGHPDAGAAKTVVDGLAEAVAQNRRALLALTSLKNYDNYTFTHMVNVSILMMAQARGLGIEGALLREFGLAGLMHDVGKVRTPSDVLNKPTRLTAEEFEIMKRHPVDGAEILRNTPDLPVLAPVVAFEHHLRLDGSGYPEGVGRDRLNLATMLCSIADVYDAMRSQRTYQAVFPSERIVEVLKRNDGAHFDQHLVRRFTQLMGMYPPGSLVKLDTGEIAVVLKVHAPDPYRPQVRAVADEHGRRFDVPYDLNLWDAQSGAARASVIVRPIDPAEHDIDPLAFI